MLGSPPSVPAGAFISPKNRPYIFGTHNVAKNAKKLCRSQLKSTFRPETSILLCVFEGDIEFDRLNTAT